MIRWFKTQRLRWKAMWLEAQIENGHALLLDHQERLDRCYAELRRVKSAEATITPAGTILQQALRRAGK